MSRIVLVGLVVALFGAAAGAGSVVIPLADPSDPVRVIGGHMDFDGPAPTMIIDLINEMGQPITSGNLWVNTARFYTRSEMSRAGDKKIWDCARSGHISGPPKALPPGTPVSVEVAIPASCQHARSHEHFFVEVSRVMRDS